MGYKCKNLKKIGRVKEDQQGHFDERKTGFPEKEKKEKVADGGNPIGERGKSRTLEATLHTEGLRRNSEDVGCSNMTKKNPAAVLGEGKASRRGKKVNGEVGGEDLGERYNPTSSTTGQATREGGEDVCNKSLNLLIKGGGGGFRGGFRASQSITREVFEGGEGETEPPYSCPVE